jgi:hypothetical protein
MYYMNAFQGNFKFLLNDAKPTNLVGAKIKAKSLYESCNLSGNLDILNFPRVKGDHKQKSSVPIIESTPNPISNVVEEMDKMQATFTQTTNALHNRIV